MAEKREGAALRKFKEDLAAGTPGPAYIFYGEETYLRSHYLSELRRKLIPAGFEEFNDHALDGKTLTAEALAEVVEAIRDSVDCNLYFFGKKVSQPAMYLILCGSIVLLIALYVLLNSRRGKKA